MKILLTGGAGFLGRHVARAARARGHEVAALSRHPERATGLPRDVRVLSGDLADPASLAPLARLAPQVVVHAAAVVADDDPQLHAVNVDGTRHLLDALSRLPAAPCVIHVSSFAVEDEPPTAYSESKRAAEALVRERGPPWVIVRPALIYGPGDGTNTPALVERLRAGSHWIPGGGRCTRIQPVHVEDVAQAIVAALETPAALGQVYRLAGPEPLSVRAWREAVRGASGGQAAIRSIPLPLLALAAGLLGLAGRRGPQGVLAFHRTDHAVDISQARRDLGFQPRSPADGLAATFRGGRLLSDRDGPSPASGRPSSPAGPARG